MTSRWAMRRKRPRGNGDTQAVVTDKPRLVSAKQEKREAAIDEELGRKPPMKRPITLSWEPWKDDER